MKRALAAVFVFISCSELIAQTAAPPTTSAPSTVGPVSATANFQRFQGQTVTSNVAGAPLTVDGAACSLPCSFQWTSGSQHTISALSTQSLGTGAQILLTGWSDGGGATHIVTASPGVTYTAYFTTQYYLTTAAVPAAGGSISPASGWYNSGQVVTVTASPNSGYPFTGFSCGLTGTTNPQNVTMNGPVSVTAGFAATQRVESTPSMLSFSVDGTGCAGGACTFVPQAGGDTLTSGLAVPLSNSRTPAYKFSASDGSIATQMIHSPVQPVDGGSGCPWSCRGGSCSAPVPVGPPQPAPIITSVVDSSGHNPAIILPGVPTTITINGTNFGAVPGFASFCVPGGSPRNFTEISQTTQSISSWTNNQVVEVVTIDPIDPIDPQADSGLWWLYLSVPFWISGTDWLNPSMGSFEMEPPLSVRITSRPITITATTTRGQYTANLTSTASPQGGVYTWTTSGSLSMGFDPSTPSSGPSSDHVKLVIQSTGGTGTITLAYQGPYGGTATDSFTFALTNSVSVLSWVDGSRITPDPSQLPPGDPLPGILGSPSSCAGTLLGMSLAGENNQVNVLGLLPAEIVYTNQFILNGTANSPPPPQDPGATGGSYRLYQQLQAYYEVSNATIQGGGATHYLTYAAQVGPSPEPCTGLQLFSLAAEANSMNGTFGIAGDGSDVSQLNEGRVGSAGQGTNYYLNGMPGQNYAQATPWIWSVIRFDPSGALLSFRPGDLQIFPTYQLYVNGSAVTSIAQGDLMTFIALNATSQYQGNQ